MPAAAAYIAEMIFATMLLAAVTFTPCELRNVSARCTTVSVPETPGGRTIAIHVAVIPATAARPERDPLVILPGGPGVAANGMANWVANTAFKEVRQTRDIILADYRGTGRSGALRCELPASEEALAAEYFPKDAIAQCRETLAKKADLRAYTTAAIVSDLEAVRKALGYQRLNLYGTSYGTRVALEYMRRHPKNLRAVILDGVVPPSIASPSTHARDAQHSLDGVLALCEADAACHAAYPNIRDDAKKTFTRIASEETRVNNVRFAPGVLLENFRNLLYSPERYSRVPYVLHRAANGDLLPLTTAAMQNARAIRATLDLGLLLSISCAEDLPRIDLARARAAADGTFLGTFRVDEQLAACSVWERGAVDRAFGTPVRSSVPVLLISGALDPVTPPKYGDEVARTLERSVHAIMPRGSHSGESGGCVEALMEQFIRTGAPERVELQCLHTIPAVPFVVE